MNPSQVGQSTPKPVESDRRKRFRIEFGAIQLMLFSLTLSVVLAWMFVFGILVGRGLPLVESADSSLQAQLMRFVGLGEKASEPYQQAAKTWEDPQKMVEKLNYYESLTKQDGHISDKPPVKTAIPPIRPKSVPAPVEVVRKQKITPPERPERPERPEPAPADNVQESKAVESATPRFTLLAASLKDAANAERYFRKLQAKGYSPRMEPVELAESGRWTRVLVGSFDSREEALRFAAEFNRRENMQGLVVRLGR
jgi:cell division septation protein DedD